MPDKNLNKRFKNGGEDVLEEVIDIYSEKLLRYATSILCDYYEAQDVVQEVFIASYKNRKNFDGEYLSAWLYKVTYNMCLNRIKKRKLVYFSKIFIKATYEIKFKDTFSDKTLKALKTLKPQDRALVHARVMEEMTYEELALQMGVSQVVLRKRYERARKKLVAELESEHKYRKGELDYGKEK